MKLSPKGQEEQFWPARQTLEEELKTTLKEAVMKQAMEVSEFSLSLTKMTF